MRTAVLLYLVLAATPALAFWAAAIAVERSGRRPRRARATPVAVGRPLERLVADLRRLEEEYSRISRSGEPHRAKRLRAVGLAYDDTLRDCCRVVGLPEPSTPPLSAVSRLQTEAALAQSGVRW